MTSNFFTKTSHIDAPVEEVFKWHSRPGAIERLSPPWDPLKVLMRSGGIEKGAEVLLKMHAGPIPFHWHAVHTDFQENSLFQDRQLQGPFSKWIHTHRFSPGQNNGCILEDKIEYRLPVHPISRHLSKPFIQKKTGTDISIQAPNHPAGSEPSPVQ